MKMMFSKNYRINSRRCYCVIMQEFVLDETFLMMFFWFDGCSSRRAVVERLGLTQENAHGIGLPRGLTIFRCSRQNGFRVGPTSLNFSF